MKVQICLNIKKDCNRYQKIIHYRRIKSTKNRGISTNRIEIFLTISYQKPTQNYYKKQYIEGKNSKNKKPGKINKWKYKFT